MAWPTTPISTVNLDADSDSISAARADLKLAVDAINDLIDFGEPSGGGGGVTSIIAGTGISVNQSTGDVTITATGSGSGSIGRVAQSFATGTAGSGTTETISNSVLIPANTFAAGDVIEIYTQWNSGATTVAGNCVFSMWFNTSNSLTGAVGVNSFFGGSSQALHYRIRTSLDVIDAASNTRGFKGSPSANYVTNPFEASGFGTDNISPNPTTFSIDWTQNQYLILAGAVYNTSNGGSVTNVGYQIYKR